MQGFFKWMMTQAVLTLEAFPENRLLPLLHFYFLITCSLHCLFGLMEIFTQ